MRNIIFHTLTNSSSQIIKKIDVTTITNVFYYKRMFKIFGLNNNYTLGISYDNNHWFSNNLTLIDYPTEQRCKNEKFEIEFKQNALNKYVAKLQYDIIPKGYFN